MGIFAIRTSWVKKTPEGNELKFGSFLVIDFDYCGKIKEEVRYPLDLNTMDIWRPEGATGGAVIEADHDLEMLNRIYL